MESLLTIVLILALLWAAGFITFHIAGGLIHILVVVAIIVVLIRIILGKKLFK